MPVLNQLLSAYESQGLTIIGNMNPIFFGDNPATPGVYLEQADSNGHTSFVGGGISFTDINCFEHLCYRLKPKTILIIGNCFGWSTLALALMNPEAIVVSIDGVIDGNELTNKMAKQLGLTNCYAETGLSPMDVAPICKEKFGGLPVDLFFIDAEHTDEAQSRDFNACWGIASKTSVFVFHDVFLYRLGPSFQKILDDTGLKGNILHRTSSGLAVAYHPSMREAVSDAIEVYEERHIEQAEFFFRSRCWPPDIRPKYHFESLVRFLGKIVRFFLRYLGVKNASTLGLRSYIRRAFQ